LHGSAQSVSSGRYMANPISQGEQDLLLRFVVPGLVAVVASMITTRLSLRLQRREFILKEICGFIKDVRTLTSEIAEEVELHLLGTPKDKVTQQQSQSAQKSRFAR
jgi:hypothetical protein